MTANRVTLRPNGTILLGDSVSCDGFAYKREVRVQTHIHSDHMIEFQTSKANQKIVMSPETKEVLVAIHNADLPFRSNIAALDYGALLHLETGESIDLLPSNHMLGSCQVRVRCDDGRTVGYSSDFFWPLTEVIQVDELVVDSTYGNPESHRRYTQELVDDLLVSTVMQSVRAGKPTAVIGHVGRLHTAMALLCPIAYCPFVCAERAHRPVEAYRRYGFPIPKLTIADSPDGLRLLRDREPCIAFVTIQERRHLAWVDRMSKVTLSAYHTNNDSPIVDYGNGDFCIAYTDHADFAGTLEYVAATGASQVWTDPRTGNAEALANALKRHLGVAAGVVPRMQDNAWG